MLTIIVCDGAGTAGLPPEDPRSILAPVAERIRSKTGASVWNIGWAASLMGVGGSTPWPVASDHAVDRIADHVRSHDGQFIILGFSAGCRPAREFAERHPDLRHRIAAIGLMADPWQPRSRQQHGVPDGPGWGIMGEKLGPIPTKTYWCGHPGDPICRAAPDSLLRYITPAADKLPGQFLRSFVDHAHRGRLQLIPFLGLPLHEWFMGLGPRIDRSVREARSYLGQGHTHAYLTPYPTPDGETDSLAHRLADSIAWKINSTEAQR